MAYFNICPKCGSHLDPGERCDCTEDKPSAPALQRAVAETARIIPTERAYFEGLRGERLVRRSPFGLERRY